MNTEQNKAVLRTWLECWNKGSIEALESLAEQTYTADFVIFDNGQPGQVVGIEGVKQFVREVFQNTSEFHLTMEDLITEGDKVAGRYTVRGVNRATGEPEHTAVTDCIRFANGKIAEVWSTSLLVEPQSQVIVKALDAAVNAGDIDRVMTFFADDAVLKSPQDPKIYTGKQQIRAWFAPQMNHFHVVSKNHRVTGNTVTWQGTLTGDIVKQMGSDSINEIAEAIVKDGKISSFTLIITSHSP